MNLRQRISLAAVLAPAFWLPLVWIYFVSPVTITLRYGEALIYTFVAASVCAYSVVLFASLWSDIKRKANQ